MAWINDIKAEQIYIEDMTTGNLYTEGEEVGTLEGYARLDQIRRDGHLVVTEVEVDGDGNEEKKAGSYMTIDELAAELKESDGQKHELRIWSEEDEEGNRGVLKVTR